MENRAEPSAEYASPTACFEVSIAKGSQASATLLEDADKAYAASFCYFRFVCTYAERSMPRIRPFCNFSEIVVHVTFARLSADSQKSVRNTWAIEGL